MVLLGERVGPPVALGPPRDALDEARFCRGNLLQPLLELLPYAWHCEEAGRAGPLERLYEGALEGVWPREK